MKLIFYYFVREKINYKATKFTVDHLTKIRYYAIIKCLIEIVVYIKERIEYDF